jgi:LDH2 family malate/lactate/ureidoglycolate dehydrogenase
MTALYNADEIEKLCTGILANAGVDRQDAARVANNLVGANKRGVDSHGILRMTAYVNSFTSGSIASKTVPVVVKETLSTAVVDAQNGWGAPAGTFAMQLAIDKAKKTGMAAVGVKRTNHFGFAAYYGMMALEHDMIGISLTNARPNVPPWAARQAYFGTNPICVCVPTGKERPLVYDGATTVVAQGKIQLANKKHVPIPPNWAMDKTGTPTTDAAVALEAGLLMPMSTYKGSDLALMVDVLSGVLPGAAFGGTAGFPALWGNQANIGHFFTAIDVAAFIDVDEFKSKTDQMVQDIKKLPLAKGMDRIYLPGEIEFDNETERTKNGLPVVDDVVEELKVLAAKYGVEMPSPVGQA